MAIGQAISYIIEMAQVKFYHFEHHKMRQAARKMMNAMRVVLEKTSV
jgi:hypothetical protein